MIRSLSSLLIYDGFRTKWENVTIYYYHLVLDNVKWFQLRIMARKIRISLISQQHLLIKLFMMVEESFRFVDIYTRFWVPGLCSTYSENTPSNKRHKTWKSHLHEHSIIHQNCISSSSNSRQESNGWRQALMLPQVRFHMLQLYANVYEMYMA